eukprot:6215422-Amphidinium_carterae.1
MSLKRRSQQASEKLGVGRGWQLLPVRCARRPTLPPSRQAVYESLKHDLTYLYGCDGCTSGNLRNAPPSIDQRPKTQFNIPEEQRCCAILETNSHAVSRGRLVS